MLHGVGVVDPRTGAALAVSFVLHAGAALLVLLYARSLPAERPLAPPADVWAGRMVEITTEAGGELGRTVPAVPGQPSPEPAPETAANDEAAEPTRASRPAAPSPPAQVAGPARAEPSIREAPPEAARPAPERVARAPRAERVEAEAPAVEPQPADLASRILSYRPTPRPRPAAEEPAGSGTPGPVEPPAPLGAAGEAGPPRNFARAFTRAIPAATTHDPAWTHLPAGPAGELEFTVEIDAAGQVAARDLGRDPPAHLERLVDRTLLALGGGRFELAGATSGKQRLRLSVNLSDQPVDEGPLALGFRSPGPGAPGLAYFQLASGRRVDVIVTLLP
jgi:hypothetical protein